MSIYLTEKLYNSDVQWELAFMWAYAIVTIGIVWRRTTLYSSPSREMSRTKFSFKGLEVLAKQDLLSESCNRSRWIPGDYTTRLSQVPEAKVAINHCGNVSIRWKL